MTERSDPPSGLATPRFQYPGFLRLGRALRFCVFSFLFCVCPFVLSGFLGWYLFSLDDAFQQNQAYEELQSDLNTFVCQIDPRYHVSRRFSQLFSQLFRRPITPERVEKLCRMAARVWGFSFDVYAYNRAGDLLTPPAIPLQSRFLLARLWELTGWRVLNPFEVDQYKGFFNAYEQYKKPLQARFGENFLTSQVSGRRGNVYDFSANGRKGLMYWQIAEKDFSGGAQIVTWELPSSRQILARLAPGFRKRNILFFALDEHGKPLFSDRAVSSSARDRFISELDTFRQPWALNEGMLWTTLQMPLFRFYCGKAVPSPFSANFRQGLALIWMGAFLLVMVLSFRWIVQGKDFYVSIPVKLTTLFLFALFLPMLGLTFLTHRAIKDGKAAQIAECFKTGQNVLQCLDDAFLTEKVRIRDFCRKLYAAAAHPDKDRLETWVKACFRQQLLTDFKLLRLDNSPLVQLNFPISETMEPLVNEFAKVCVERHLGERLLQQPDQAPRGGNLTTRMVLEANETGFPAIVDNPDVVHTIQFGDQKNLWYWNYYRDPSSPAAILFITQRLDWAGERFLKKAVSRRESFRHGQFRIVVRKDDGPTWFPRGLNPEPALEDLMNRVRIAQGDFSDRVILRGKPFLVAAHPGKQVPGYSFLALFPEREIDRQISRLRNWVGWGTLFILVTTVSLGLALSDTFLAPIMDLRRGIEALELRQNTFRLTPHARDEFGDLALVYNRMMENLQEISMGKVVQERLLPRLVLQHSGYSVFGLSQPASDLGGDYFDFGAVQGKYLWAIMGDVTGHGIPSALVMAMSKAIIQAGMERSSPVEVLQTLNRSIYDTMEKKLFLTCCLAIVPPDQEEITIYNFGHPYPITLTVDSRAEMQKVPPGLPLGLRETLKFKPLTIRLKPGERLVLYTDGLVEHFPEGGRRDGFELFMRFLEKHQKESVEETCREVLAMHPFWSMGQPQPDDFSLLLLERDRPGGGSGNA